MKYVYVACGCILGGMCGYALGNTFGSFAGTVLTLPAGLFIGFGSRWLITR